MNLLLHATDNCKVFKLAQYFSKLIQEKFYDSIVERKIIYIEFLPKGQMISATVYQELKFMKKADSSQKPSQFNIVKIFLRVTNFYHWLIFNVFSDLIMKRKTRSWSFLSSKTHHFLWYSLACKILAKKYW